MKRILVPLDGSGLAEAVMPTALELGRALDAEWILLRVVMPAPSAWTLASASWGPVGPWGDALGSTEEARQEARAYLEAVRAKMSVAPDRVALDVREGVLPSALLNAVAEDHADLIAMSTHGRGGVNRLVMGSVTDMVIRMATVPVVVVRPPITG
jgi:nucleotide-binding universal stress UspA family protein